MIFVLLLLLAVAAIIFFIAQKFQNPTTFILRMIAFLFIALVALLYMDMAGLLQLGIV